MRDGDDKSYVITGYQNDSDQASDPEHITAEDIVDQNSEPEQLNAADVDHASDISEPEIISSVSNGNGESSDSMSRSSVLVPSISDLPSTVTFLEGPNGSQVYIIGTAHFSEESNLDVVNTLERVRPHIVCLELCKNRLHVIKFTDEEILEEVQNIGLNKVKELIARSGVFHGLFQLAFLHLSARLTKQLGLAPGGEFRAAYRKGRELGCTFRLSDRSIQTTLRRALYSLTIWKQLGLAVKLIFNNEKITKEDVESFKGDLLQKLIEEIAGEYPNLSRIFVDERDQYLSSKIYGAAGESTKDLGCRHHREEDDTDPEEAVEEAMRIVAVVGIGHIAGIRKYWGTKVDREEMCRIPEPSLQSKIIGKTIKYSIIGLLCYTTFKTLSYSYSLVHAYLPASPFTEHINSFMEYAQSFLPM